MDDQHTNDREKFIKDAVSTLGLDVSASMTGIVFDRVTRSGWTLTPPPEVIVDELPSEYVVRLSTSEGFIAASFWRHMNPDAEADAHMYADVLRNRNGG